MQNVLAGSTALDPMKDGLKREAAMGRVTAYVLERHEKHLAKMEAMAKPKPWEAERGGSLAPVKARLLGYLKMLAEIE